MENEEKKNMNAEKLADEKMEEVTGGYNCHYRDSAVTFYIRSVFPAHGCVSRAIESLEINTDMQNTESGGYYLSRIPDVVHNKTMKAGWLDSSALTRVDIPFDVIYSYYAVDYIENLQITKCN